jgi:hypothetical protein
MAKYTAKDEDVKSMYQRDRVDYDIFLLDYDVDANAETAQGKSAIQMLSDTIKTKKFQPIKNLYNMYTAIYAFLIAIAFILMFVLIFIWIVFGLMVLFKKDPISKTKFSVLNLVFLFAFGVLLLIYLFTKIKDTAQLNQEKIIYVL